MFSVLPQPAPIPEGIPQSAGHWLECVPSRPALQGRTASVVSGSTSCLHSLQTVAPHVLWLSSVSFALSPPISVPAALCREVVKRVGVSAPGANHPVTLDNVAVTVLSYQYRPMMMVFNFVVNLAAFDTVCTLGDLCFSAKYHTQ